MRITDLLAGTGGLQAIARQLGIDESQAASGADALMPAILGGLRRQAQPSSPGTQSLEGLLERFGGGSLLDAVAGQAPADPARGNDILGQIFGSKEVSRAVAQDASARSGVDASVLRKMLPMLAMLAAGFLSKQGAQGAAGDPGASSGGLGGLGGLLGGVLGASGGGASGGGGALGALASMLDRNGDGNPLDDILRSLGK